jgi:hypothetical protein
VETPFRESVAAVRRAALGAPASGWTLLRVEAEVVDRARRPFPGQPIRTLDALHLASARAARAAVPGLSLLGLDRRVRGAGAALGFAVVPADPS